MTRPFLLAALAMSACPAIAQTPEPKLSFAFEEMVALGERIAVGKTPFGERFIIPITGGTFDGPGIKGTIIPGAWDWQLLRPDGCVQVKADYFLRTDDGVVINVVNTGAICPAADGNPSPVRTHPVFEAPMGKYDWLGKASFVGTLEPVSIGGKVSAVRIRFYRAL